MFFTPFSISRVALAALLLSLPASVGWARGDAGVSVAPRVSEASAASPAVADQLDALLTARFEEAGSVAAPEARRQALQVLGQFAAMTVEGLINASPDSETRALMDERLRPILARHQANIAAALATAERPTARRGAPASSAGGF